MYTQVFYFIIVFTLFSINEPATPSQETGGVSFIVDAAGILLTSLVFYFYCRNVFNRLILRLRTSPFTDEPSGSTHSRLVVRSTFAAIMLYAVFLYLFNLKYYITSIPYLSGSECAVNTTGIFVFFLLLYIVWVCAYPSYCLCNNSTLSMKHYLGSQVRMHLPIIIPWLIFSLIFDLIYFLPEHIVEPVVKNQALSCILFGILFITIALLFPWLLVKIWYCKSMPQGTMRTRIDDFSKRCGFPYADIVLWDLFDGSLITAGVVGMLKKFRYLLISPSLIRLLNDDEMEAVVAHELGHVKYRHMLFYIFFMVGYVLIASCMLSILYGVIFTSTGLSGFAIRDDGSFSSLFYIVSAIYLIILLILYFRFAFGLFSRNFERQADAFSVFARNNSSDIIRALEKISIAGGTKRQEKNWHHYSIRDRIDFLKKCGENGQTIKKHNRKVISMVGIYTVLLCCLCVLYFKLNDGYFGSLDSTITQTVIEKRLQHEPGNVALHFAIANIYHEKKQYAKAVYQYEKTIALAPEHSEALNNLAWLYATADSPDFKKPKEALRLSLRAAVIAPIPHVLDTLAESYFVNGYYDMAVETIEKAIDLYPEDMTYYEKQLRKFKKYLDQNKARKISNDAGLLYL